MRLWGPASNRSPLRTVWDLYCSPAQMLAAARKVLWIAGHSGIPGLRLAVSTKMRHPNLPVAKLLAGGQDKQTIAFEERADWPGRGLAEAHSVTVIIPTRGNAPLLTRCLCSLLRSITPTARLSIKVINNGAALGTIPTLPWPIDLRTETRSFNWSAYNNTAAADAQTDFLLFLNDDIEAFQIGWLDVMLSAAVLSRCGVVGAKLLYPDGSIQHMGVGVSGADAPFHIARHRPRRGHDVSEAEGPREVPAVTGACLLTPRNLFHQLGGFDERFALSYNDVDYCLRVRAAGGRVWVHPQAELVHLETATRPLRTSMREQKLFASLWTASVQAASSRDE